MLYSFERSVVFGIAVEALVAERDRLVARVRGHRAEELNELRRFNDVAILAFGDLPVICNMFRISKLELALAEAALHGGSDAFADRAQRNALAWFDAGLLETTHVR